MHMINNFDLGQVYRHVRVKPTLKQPKSDPNDLDNLDDPTRLQRWFVAFCFAVLVKHAVY